MKNQLSTKSLFVLIFTTVIIIYLIIFLKLPDNSFWIRDCGNKFLILNKITYDGLKDISFNYPGKKADPESKYFPIKEPFARVLENDRYVSQYQVFFSLLSYPLYKAAGFKGIFIIPLISAIIFGIFILFNTGKWVNKNFFILYMLTVFLGTPLLFYSFVFWEHSLAVLLVTAGLILLFKSRVAAISGLFLMVSAMMFREEVFFLIISVILCGYYFKFNKHTSYRTILSSTVLFLISFFILNLAFDYENNVFFHIKGNYLLDDTLTSWIKFRWEVFHNLYLANNINMNVDIIISFLLIFIFVMGLLFKISEFWIILLAVFVSVYEIFNLSTVSDYTFQLLKANGLFVTFPIFILMLINLKNTDKAEESNFLRNVVFSYFILIAFFCPRESAYGIHWSSRLALVIIPFMLFYLNLILKMKIFNNKSKMLFVFLIALNILIQIYSVYLLLEKKYQTSKLVEYIEKNPDKPIISNVDWLAEDLAYLYNERLIYYTGKNKRMEGLNKKSDFEKYMDDIYNLKVNLKSLGYKSVIFIEKYNKAVQSDLIFQSPNKKFGFFDLQATEIQLS